MLQAKKSTAHKVTTWKAYSRAVTKKLTLEFSCMFLMLPTASANHDKHDWYRCFCSCCVTDAENPTELGLACFWYWKAVYKYYLIHEIVRSLGPQKNVAFPAFYASTDCDTVSLFAGKSKKNAWDTWNVFPGITRSFLEIYTSPDDLSDDCMYQEHRTICCTAVRSRKRVGLSRWGSTTVVLQALPYSGSNSTNICCFEAAPTPCIVPRWLCMEPSPLNTTRASESSWVWLGKRWFMETSVGNLAASPAKLLWACSLLLQESLRRVVQVFESQPAVYSPMCLWRKLPQLGKILIDIRT